MMTTTKTRIHKTALMKEIIGYFDASGMCTRGLSVVRGALGNASEPEMDRLKAWIASQEIRRRSVLERWLGAEIAGERRYRERTQHA